ncbi:hypothetical protein [Anaeroselena agilis]|uniref:Uncharacterized protein n=1 Tax=Anaeroselena agilis TaxID=3063788 RepID=A0ABU3P676_9FIRM|nr:hypothetical protein [Selenomonadales bacterium 4137-cl]
MKKMVVEALTPGMVVAREVVSREGVVLLEKGGRLTQAHIAILTRREVPFVYIKKEE